ncbi:MAG: TonB-dependent receptor, partial [Desulfobacterales bacterium]
RSWRYGIAVDQKFSPAIYGGLEYSERKLDVPVVNLITDRVEIADWEENLARAYLYWTPHPLLALSAEYLFERFQRDELSTGEEAIRELKTHRFPMGISLFHPSGFSAQLKTTYIDQKGTFGTSPDDFFRDNDQFWVVDAAIRYRLPKRLGLITVAARNLFDEDFNFQDMDLANQVIFPERVVFGKITLAF